MLFAPRCAPSPRMFLTVAGIALCTAPAFAVDTWPNRPLRIVTSEPGGGSDFTARVVAQGLTQSLGQQVIVDNRGGANGNIGLELTAKAPADGYTIVIATVGTWAVNPSLYKNMPFDPVKDFAPIIQVSS